MLSFLRIQLSVELLLRNPLKTAMISHKRNVYFPANSWHVAREPLVVRRGSDQKFRVVNRILERKRAVVGNSPLCGPQKSDHGSVPRDVAPNTVKLLRFGLLPNLDVPPLRGPIAVLPLRKSYQLETKMKPGIGEQVGVLPKVLHLGAKLLVEVIRDGLGHLVEILRHTSVACQLGPKLYHVVVDAPPINKSRAVRRQTHPF